MWAQVFDILARFSRIASNCATVALSPCIKVALGPHIIIGLGVGQVMSLLVRRDWFWSLGDFLCMYKRCHFSEPTLPLRQPWLFSLTT